VDVLLLLFAVLVVAAAGLIGRDSWDVMHAASSFVAVFRWGGEPARADFGMARRGRGLMLRGCSCCLPIAPSWLPASQIYAKFDACRTCRHRQGDRRDAAGRSWFCSNRDEDQRASIECTPKTPVN